MREKIPFEVYIKETYRQFLTINDCNLYNLWLELKSTNHKACVHIENLFEDYGIDINCIEKKSPGKYYITLSVKKDRLATEDEVQKLLCSLVDPVFRSTHGDEMAKKHDDNIQFYIMDEVVNE